MAGAIVAIVGGGLSWRRAIVRGLASPKTSGEARLNQQRIQLASRLQGAQVIRAANMLAINKNLRHGFAAARFFHHRLTLLRIQADINFGLGHLCLIQQLFGHTAIGAGCTSKN